MPAMTITMNGDGAWPDLDSRQEDVIHLANDAVIEVAMLEGGMSSGLPSVAFRFDLPDGRVVVAETSWRLFAAAARAAALQFGWPK